MIQKRSRWISRKGLLLALVLATLLGGGFVTYHREHLLLWLAGASTAVTPAVEDSHFRPLPISFEINGNVSDNELEVDLAVIIADWQTDGDSLLLDRLTPTGIQAIQGSGGQGLSRQVKTMGMWFPVFDLSRARRRDGSQIESTALGVDVDPDTVSLTKIPLSIVAASPPRVMVGETLDYTFGAIGGVPPYQWHQSGGNWVMEQLTGRLSGPAGPPAKTPISVTVTDSVGAHVSIDTEVVVIPDQPLVIVTESLGVVEVEQQLSIQLEGKGGVSPYTWALTSSIGLTCDSISGKVTGSVSNPGDYEAVITLRDDQGTEVSTTLLIKVSEGLEIVTDYLLPSAEPEVPYTQLLEARGGTEPYRWTVEGDLPPRLTLDSSGLLKGIPFGKEGLYRFTVRVEDSLGLHHIKAMQLPIMQALVAVPSRRCAGLAWRNRAVERRVGGRVVSAIISRDGPDGSREIQIAGRSNFVDRGLSEGASYDYRLAVTLADGRKVSVGRKKVAILPIALVKGTHGIRGDPFADRVVSYRPLSANGFGARLLPDNVLGPPNGMSTYEPAFRPEHLVSLHASSIGGGEIVLEFTDNIVAAGQGEDLTVFENVMFVGRNPLRRFMEPAIIEVALFDDDWVRFPAVVLPSGDSTQDVWQPQYYAQGFAGINATTGDNPTDPSRSGGDSFDFARLGRSDLSWVRFVRIRSTGDNVTSSLHGVMVRHNQEMNATSGVGSSGFDLDAVSAVHF